MESRVAGIVARSVREEKRGEVTEGNLVLLESLHLREMQVHSITMRCDTPDFYTAIVEEFFFQFCSILAV